jgi:predicted  nucleic acid-binding Zn-ribbon protein
MPNPSLDNQRAALLRNRMSQKTELVPSWPRSEKELKRVEVETTWVRFSTLNHRTKAEQMRLISQTGRSDLFSADPLGDEAQEAQYRILRGQEGFSDLKEDLRDRGQQDTAILTADGVLINGNRRAAALRTLFVDEDVRSARYIQCLVLPDDATIEEIVDLEAALQIARDFREDYSWINEALLIEELYEREGRSWSKVAARMHRKPFEVIAMYDKLLQVQQLVELSNGARHYVDFKDNESAFDELAKHVKNKSPEEAEGVRNAYFLGTLAGANYRDLRHLRRGDAADLVVAEMENDPSLQPVLAAASQAVASEGDLLDEVLGEAGPSPLGDLLSFVAAKKDEETLSLPDGKTVSINAVLASARSAINAAAAEAEEDNRDLSAVQAPLNRVDKALRQLELAVKVLPRARNLDGWDEAAMQERVDALAELVQGLRTED